MTSNAEAVPKRRVMVLAPHPDDAELAMGGSIVKLIKQGHEVILVDLTNGEPTPKGSPEIRAKEAALAAEIMGVKTRVCLELPNRYVMETLDNRRVVAEVIRQYAPDWLFTVALPDAHPDHIHTHALIQDARFSAKLTKTDMAHDPHYPTHIFYFFSSHLRQHIQPSFVLDISQEWEAKVEAVKAYQSQFSLNQNKPDRPDWVIEHISGICRYFGTRIGVEYAEPFYCPELLALSNLDAII